MQRISSALTFFYKRAFPFLIFPVSIAAGLITAAKSGADLFSLLVFAFALIIGYAGMKLIGLFDLVDEVLDAGDALIVRNGDREERVPLADIIDVSYKQPTFGRPQLGRQQGVRRGVREEVWLQARMGRQQRLYAVRALGGGRRTRRQFLSA